MFRSVAHLRSTIAVAALSFLVSAPSAAAQMQHGQSPAGRGASQGSGSNGTPFTCTVTGPDRLCGANTSHPYTATVTPMNPGLTYLWTLENTTIGNCIANGSPTPSFCGPNGGSTVCVSPGNSTGRFVLKVFISNGYYEATCCLSVGVTASTSSSPLADAGVCPGETHTFCTTASGTGPFTYEWTKNGTVIPGATGSCYTATGGPVGTSDFYCVTTTGSGVCGVPYTTCATLTSFEDVSTTPLVGATVCSGSTYTFCTTASGTGPFTYEWTRNGVVIPGATGSCYTATAGGAMGMYCVTVTGACGTAMSCATLMGQPVTTATPLVDVNACPGDTRTFCTTAGGTGPFTYEWTMNGSTIPGATDSCYTATAGEAGAVDTYCVTVTGTCGSVTRCATFTSNTETKATNPGSAATCPGFTHTFCTVASGSGPFSYFWKKNGVFIPGATDSCYTATAGPLGTTDLYCVIVAGACNQVTQCATLASVACSGSFTTLTQGTLSDPGGQFNGAVSGELVEQFLQGDLTVGVLGLNSLTLQTGSHDAQCVVDLLPMTGLATPLPAFGDETLESDCQTDPIPIPTQNGRFESVLLGQVMTLSLNVRLNEGMTTGGGCTTLPADLTSSGILPTMVSRTILPGPDGCMGTADDEPDLLGPDGDPNTPDNLVTVTIPDSVSSSLFALDLPLTVGGLLELGNLAIAGEPTDSATLDDISLAIDALNVLFEGGRENLSYTLP